MKILAIDTSGKALGIAVLSGDRILFESYLDTGLNHSQVLLPEIERAMQALGMTLNDVDLFAATAGPGSFTGLRIGLSTLKGFALSRRKPLIGVSTLEAMAQGICAESILLCPIISGPLKEIYAGLYRRLNPGGLTCIVSDRITDLERLVERIQEPVIFLGEGALRQQSQLQGLLPQYAQFCFDICRASSVAAVGLRKFRKQEIQDMVSLIPTYLRVSEAEQKHGRG